MKAWRLTIILLVVLAGCSKSDSNSGSNSGIVQAQSFSNANVSGMYGWDFSGRIGSAGVVTTTVLGTGTLVANGGVFNLGFSETMVSISSGAITVCSGNISGSYNIGPSGSGTSSFSLVGSFNQNSTGTCPTAGFGSAGPETFNL